MKTVLFVFVLIVCTTSGILAQNNYIDSLTKLANNSTGDSSKLNALLFLSSSLAYSQPDSGLLYARKCLELSQKLNYAFAKAASNFLIAENLNQLGDYPSALSYALKAMSSFEDSKDTSAIIFSTELIGDIYRDEGDYKQALEYFYKNRELYESQPDGTTFNMLFVGRPKEDGLVWGSVEIGNCYIYSDPDSAISYGIKAYQFYKNVYQGTALYPLVVAGGGYVTKNQPDSALKWYRIGLETADEDVAKNDLSDVYIGMAKAFLEKGVSDSCIYYAEKALSLCNKISYLKGVYDVTNLLATVYENVDPKKSVKYYKLNKATYDSIYSRQKLRDADNVAFNERIQREEVEQKIAAADLANKNREQLILLLSGLILVVFIAAALWRRNIFKQKAYALLQKQKEEIAVQKTKTETALKELKNTQAQLIQTEKMASLGELTAGIAHEIQNPLNFVNNFSEVSRELIEELKSQKSKLKSEELDDLLNDISENEEKINHHGKRADAIVKGMLQHSRASTGKKDPTDINALADEYLKLSYHGLRAKDETFNATLRTDFDLSIEKINVVPQDIGRVLLNLFNNAFYATNEKKKTANENYKPLVSVQTKKVIDKIEIKVVDNGNGFPELIKEKIFQPFFTTKPTGEGTGLGLSLSYDIIKAHGGEIKVETKEARPDDPVGWGDGTAFIIVLPVS